MIDKHVTAISPGLGVDELSLAELHRTLRKVLDELLIAIEADHSYLYLSNPDQLFFPFLAAGAINPSRRNFFETNILDPSTDGLTYFIIKGRSSILSSQALSDTRLVPSVLNELNANVILAVPVFGKQGIIGFVLNIRVENRSSFTVGQQRLAEAITAAIALAVENASLYQVTHQRLLESQGLHQITLALLQKLELEEVLEIVCKEAQRLTQAYGSSIALLEDENWLRVMYHSGESPQVPGRFQVGQSILGLAIRRGEPVLINNHVDQDNMYHPGDPVSLLALPLRVGGKIIGVLDVVNKRHGFTTDDVRLIELFADQAAVAVEHARLARQVQEMAVLEERQRLSRELHDSINQLLYGMALYSEAAQRQLAAGDLGSVSRYLTNLTDTAKEALNEMRLLIFELRPSILVQKGLHAALVARLKSVEERLGITPAFKWRVHVEIDKNIEEALYGIAQEALNNVIKHSRAKNVQVHLVQSGQTLIMKIEDDGIGFDSNHVQEGGLGLKSIRERAESLNAHLEVRSQPLQGTCVMVEVQL